MHMHSSNKNKIIAIIGVLVIIILAEMCLRFLLKPWTLADELAFDLHDIEKSGNNITCIVLGDSTSRSEINPVRLDETLQQESLTINASYNGQVLTSEKYNMLDLIERYPIDTVIICLNYLQLRNEGTPFTEGYVMERIKTPKIYVEAAHGLFGWNSAQYMLPSYRYRDKVTWIPDNLQHKLRTKTEKIAQKESIRGYIPTPDNFGIGGAEVYSMEMNVEEVVPKLEASLAEMIGICKEKGINVYLFGMPYASTTLINSYDNMNALNLHINQFAAANGVRFYDLNLMKNRQKLLADSELNSLEHMTEIAVPAITDMVADIINAETLGGSVDSYLFHNMAEARNDLKGIVGMHVETSTDSDGSTTVAVTAVSAENETLYYEFSVENEGGTRILQDYTENNVYTVPDGTIAKGEKLLVNVRNEDGRTMWRKVSW